MSNDIMQEFDDSPTCPKCKADKEFNFEYCETPGSREICTGYPERYGHLHITCECGYFWISNTDDADGVARQKKRGLYVYDSDCMKCGESDARMTFVPSGKSKVFPQEHLDATCKCCGFQWSMQTADADSNDTEEEKEEEKEKDIDEDKATEPPPRPLRDIRSYRED